MNILTVSTIMIEDYSKPKLGRWMRLSPKQKVQYRKPRMFPVCQGCRCFLKPGDGVYEFRKQTFVHESLKCIHLVNKYLMTKELRILLNA